MGSWKRWYTTRPKSSTWFCCGCTVVTKTMTTEWIGRCEGIGLTFHTTGRDKWCGRCIHWFSFFVHVRIGWTTCKWGLHRGWLLKWILWCLEGSCTKFRWKCARRSSITGSTSRWSWWWCGRSLERIGGSWRLKRISATSRRTTTESSKERSTHFNNLLPWPLLVVTKINRSC